MTNNVLPLPMWIGLVWIMISIYNFFRYIPAWQQRKTNLVAFIGFCLISPLANIAYGFLVVAKWVYIFYLRISK